MGITPKDPAHFDPTMGTYTDLKPFRFWCQKVLPLVYDDSLSYYEVLCKVVDYLNKAMEDVGVLHDDVDALHVAYQQLENYVNTYFSTLDVQQEINNKLDTMASDGTLDALLLPYFNAYKTEINGIVAEQNQTIANQNNNIATLVQRMDSFSRLTEGSTTGDAELADIRVGANGVTYATAGDAVRGQYSELNKDIKHIVNDTNNTLTIPSFVQGTIGDGDGTNYPSDTEIRTNDYIRLPIRSGYHFTCGDDYKFTIHTYNSSKTYIGSSYWKNGDYVMSNDSGNIAFVRIKIASRSGEAVTPSAVTDMAGFVVNVLSGKVDTNTANISALADVVEDKHDEIITDFEGVINDTPIEITLPSFEQGTVGDGDGGLYPSDTNIRTVDYIYLPLNCKYIVRCDYDYRFTVLTYDSSKTYIASSYWKFDKYVFDNTNGSIRYIKIKIVGRNMEAVLPTADTGIDLAVNSTLSNKLELVNREANTLSNLIVGGKTTCEIGNGTIPNAGNTYCVKTNNYIPCSAGDIVYINTTKPLVNDGDYYVYGYSVYDSSRVEILRVNLSNTSVNNNIAKIPADGAFIRFSLGENDSSNNHVTLRTYNFLDYEINVYVQDSRTFINYLYLSGIMGEYELPNYWIDYLNNNIDDYNIAIADNVGFYGETFFFFTDVHWSTNEKYSPSIIKWLKDNLSVDTVVQGGDILDRHDTRQIGVDMLQNYVSYTKNLYPVNLVGNHDDNSNGQSTETTRFVGAGAFYRILNADTENVVKWVAGKNYGYSDNLDQKIRHIYLDTGTPDLAVIDQDQLDWVGEVAGELNNTWNVVVFGHMFMSPEPASTPTLQLNQSGWKVAQVLSPIALNQSKASIVAMICGHTHRDYSVNEPYNGLFPIICTTSDNGSRTTSYDPNSQYVANTVTAQAIDIFCINTNSKSINTIRVGNGSNRSWTYTN